jgi:hypothetical protein
LLAQPLRQGPDQRVVGVRRDHVEEADAWEPLGAQGPRWQRGQSDGRQELASLHSITSSAPNGDCCDNPSLGLRAVFGRKHEGGQTRPTRGAKILTS